MSCGESNDHVTDDVTRDPDMFWVYWGLISRKRLAKFASYMGAYNLLFGALALNAFQVRVTDMKSIQVPLLSLLFTSKIICTFCQ